MKPIAYVFVIISTKTGPSRCALSYEDETDESLALRRIKARLSSAGFAEWLPHKDSNLNKQIQNLRCYHYTMRQWGENGA